MSIITASRQCRTRVSVPSLHRYMYRSSLARIPAESSPATSTSRDPRRAYHRKIRAGRGIILVEGDAERFIVPATARLLDPSIELDDYGISVCSVSGTDFAPYVKLLDHFDIPHVVVTDGDADDTDDDGQSPGIKRGLSLLAAIGRPVGDAPEGEEPVEYAIESLRENGIFVGEKTLEVDMLNAGAGERMARAYMQIRGGTRRTTLAAFWMQAPLSDEEADDALALVERVGKGRFAQRVAIGMTPSDVPEYVRDAITFLTERLKP